MLNYSMGKRITVIIDEDLLKKLYEKQSKQIKENLTHISFSRVLNDVLRKCIK